MLNYVILITHSSHLYSMWDFTYMCNPIISSSRVSLPLYRFQDLSVGHELVLLTPPCLMGFFTSSTHHPWVSHTSSMRTTCQLRTHIHENPNVHVHENLTSHHYLAPLAIFLLFVFCFFFVFLFFCFKIFVCGPFKAFFVPVGRDHEHLTTFTTHHHGL